MPRYLPNFVALAVVVSCTLGAPSGAQTTAPAGDASRVTPVTGESWLEHLHRSFNETSMGKTNRLGPRPPAPGEEDDSNWKPGLLSDFPRQSEVVRGSDLYRMNCQGCHGEMGLGAPPEINSIIGPIRATSAALVLERMRSMGVEVSRAGATQLAKQSENALWQRLHTGGQDMPGFGHLSAAELQGLVAYLRELAGVPGAQRDQRTLREPSVRVGELIVKSTCHICHGSTGPNPSPEQMKAGAIPPLATLTARTDFAGFIRKITIGAPLATSDAAGRRRGRMPVFNYLSESEAADVYLYLSLYLAPKNQFANPGHSSAGPGSTAADAGSTFSSPSSASSLPSSAAFQQEQADDRMVLVLIAGIAWLSVYVLAGGIVLTIGEFKRLAARGKHLPAVQRICAEEPPGRSRLTAKEGGARMLMRRAADAADAVNRVQTTRGSYAPKNA